MGPEITAYVPAEDAGEQINYTGNYKQPCSKKMQASSPTILVEDIVRPARTDRRGRVFVEWRAFLKASVTIISADRKFEERRSEIIARFTPIKTRMAHENDKAGECKGEKAGRDDPMSHFNPGRMANWYGQNLARGRLGARSSKLAGIIGVHARLLEVN